MATAEALSPERGLSKNERNNGATYLINSLNDVLAVSPGYQKVLDAGINFFNEADGTYRYEIPRNRGYSVHTKFISREGLVEIRFDHSEFGRRTEDFWFITKGNEIATIEEVIDWDVQDSHFRYIGVNENVGERDSVRVGSKILELFASFKDA